MNKLRMNLSSKIFNWAFYLILGLFIVIGLKSCQKDDAEQNLASYYYPELQNGESLIMEYLSPTNDSLPAEYWLIKRSDEQGMKKYISDNYDGRFKKQQRIIETVGSDKISLQEYLIFEEFGDPIHVNIEQGDSFLTNESDTAQTWGIKIGWDIPNEDGNAVSVSKKKSFVQFDQINFEDNKYKAMLVEVFEHIEHFVEDDGYLEPQYPGLEVYAYGLGLVYSEKRLSEDVRISYHLNKCYGLEEFENKFNISLD